jgi:F-type H+-transporting ATPase subunit delta
VAARASLDAAVKGVDAHAASALSAELFFVADVLDKNIAVRRALTDSSRDASSKSAFIAELFGSKVGAAGITILKEISAMRWSGAKDLVQVLEQLAIESYAER